MSWRRRGGHGVRREKQLLIDFEFVSAGGPVYHSGRDTKFSHHGLGIYADDWDAMIRHFIATLKTFDVPEKEKREVLTYTDSAREDIVEA